MRLSAPAAPLRAQRLPRRGAAAAPAPTPRRPAGRGPTTRARFRVGDEERTSDDWGQQVPIIDEEPWDKVRASGRRRRIAPLWLTQAAPPRAQVVRTVGSLKPRAIAAVAGGLVTLYAANSVLLMMPRPCCGLGARWHAATTATAQPPSAPPALAAGVLNTLDHLPLVPSALKLLGLGASLWFWARYGASRRRPGPTVVYHHSQPAAPPPTCACRPARRPLPAGEPIPVPPRPAAPRRFLVYHPGRREVSDNLEEIRARLQAFADGVDDSAVQAGGWGGAALTDECAAAAPAREQAWRRHADLPLSPPALPCRRLHPPAAGAAAELQQELVAQGERAWDVVQGEARDSRTSRDLGRVYDDAGRAVDEASQAVEDAGRVVDDPEY